MAKYWGCETGQQLKNYFIDMLGEGWKVLPLCECENFDKEKGCGGFVS